VALLVLAPVLAFATPAGVANFLFLQTYKPAWVRSGTSPGWSVCVEVSFYVLLPGFAALLERRWGALASNHHRRAHVLQLAAHRLPQRGAVFSINSSETVDFEVEMLASSISSPTG